MAKPFNLTVALNLQGPNNVKKVVADIRRQLTGIKAEVKLDIQADSAKNIANINKQLNSLSSTAKAANVNVTTLSRSLSSLSTSFNQSASNAKQFNAATEKTAKSVKKGAKDLQVATTAVEEFGKQSALAVKRFAAFSIVTSIINRFSSAISDSLSDFIEFDRQLVRVAQVTKGTQSELSALSQEIGRLASNFGVASKDLAEVSVTLSQAGLTAAQTKTALEALAKTSLAATFNDINSTTEGSIALMRQFRIGVQDLESALGSINAVAGQFAVESSDIITAISRAGGVFASASKGVSEGKDALNEFVAVFTSVRATTRESAETIATGLRTIFTRIQRGSTIKFLREFGVELQDSQGKFVGAYEAIRRLSEGLGQLDPRDVRFTKIVEELGGFRQIGKVIPLIQQFTTAQEALGVAQRGAGSLTQDAIKAQQSLAVQFQQTREQFAALIREIGQSATFQTITKLVLGLANAFIKVAGSLKPILPLLTGLTAIKGFKFITEFISGFKGGLGGAGIGGIGKTIGGALGGGEGDGGGGGGKKTQAIESNTAALGSNTTALSSLTTAVSQLNASLDGTNTAIQNLINVASRTDSSSTSGGGGGILGPDGKPIGFASGGMVPGSGNRDTVKAMLTPGEFVIRKKAVESIGVDNLAKMNKYATGGAVSLPSSRPYVKNLPSTYNKDKNVPISAAVLDEKRLVLNKEDTISASIVRKPIDTISLLDRVKPDLANKYDKIIRDPNPSRSQSQQRGLLFEDILEATGQIQKAEGKTSRIDAKSGNTLVEIKSTAEQVSTESLLDKVAGAIFRPRSTNVDQIASDRVSKKSLSKDPDDLNIGKLQVFEDAARLQQAGSKFKTQGQISRDEAAAGSQVFASGGSVEDTVPAMLTPGEFVLNKKAAQKLGGVTLNRLNNADKIQGFNKGGPVGMISRFEDGGFVPGGGKVESLLEPAIDRLDANLQGLGSIIRETIVATDASAAVQNEMLTVFEDAITAINQARASGDTDAVIAAENALRAEIRYMTEGLAGFKERYNLSPEGTPTAESKQDDKAVVAAIAKLEKEIAVAYTQAGRKMGYSGGGSSPTLAPVEGSGMDVEMGATARRAYYAANPVQSGTELADRFRAEGAKLSQEVRAWLESLTPEQAQQYENYEMGGFGGRFSERGGLIDAKLTSRFPGKQQLENTAASAKANLDSASAELETITRLEEKLADIRARGIEALRPKAPTTTAPVATLESTPTPTPGVLPAGVTPPPVPAAGPMQQAPVKTGGLGYPGSMVTKPGGFNATTKQTSKLTIAFQKLTEKIDAVSNVTGSFVGTFSAGLSAALPQIDSLVENLDRLNQTTVSTSEEFMAFRGALEQGASQGLSASIAAQQAGFGRRGAAVIGGLGFAGGAVSGAISGATTARAAEFQQQAAAANVSRDRALQDFEDASSAEQRRQALKNLTKANADAANATAKANAELNSELAQAGRQVGLFSNALIQGVSALALLNSFRGGRGGRRKGFAKGGVVYASKGTFVNYQPKGTDTIPAMLSPGEFVVNARSTSKNRGVLEAINKNKGGFISGGVQYLQAGGSPTVSGDIESSADNMAASMEKAASAIEKAGQQTEQSSSTFGKAMSTAGDVLTMTSDSTAVNVASFAAQSAVAGAVPYAGAALDYSSAAVNYQRGNYVDAGVDALFGTIDLITDTIQGIGYLTGVGAPVAAAGGAGAQVAADATQAGIKQGLKNFGPAIVKQTKGAFDSVAKYGKNAFESIKDYGGTAIAAGGTLFGGLFAFGRKKGGRKAAGAAGDINPKIQDMIDNGFISAESVQGTTKASRKAKTTTGGGTAGRRGGGLANFLTNAGFFAAAALPGVIEGMSADPEVIAREQAASQERYKNTADAAIKRGQVARLSSPVAGREISELQQLRAQGLSQSQIRQRMGASAIAAGDRSGGFTQEQRRQEALAAQGFDVKAGQTVEEFINSLDVTDQSAARAAIEASDFALQLDALTAARQKELAKLQPGTAAYEEMSKEIDNEIKATKERGSISKKQIPIINEQIGATDMAAASAAELALKMAQFAKQTADLTAVMTRLSAGMKRISDDIGNVVAQTTVLTNAYSGQADAASAAAASSATMDAQVLGNLSAYSGAELEDTLGRVTQGLGGGPQITQAADLVRAQQILEKQRPTLEAAVKSTEGEGPAATQEAIEGVLLKAFENVPFADPNIGKQFAQEAARSIAEGGGDAGKNLEAFLAKSAQATKLFEQYTKMASEGLKQLAAQSDKLTQTYQKINQLQGEQAALTAQSTADLKQALGFKLTPGEATAASQARIRTLTGGPTDPTEIFNQLNKNIQERQSRIEDARAEGPQAEANLYADPGFADLNAAINQSRQALEMLANDTTAADAALQRIAERDKQLRAQADTALDFAADPTKALEFIGQAQSMSRVLSGRGGQMDVGAGQALLGRLEGMLPQEQSDALRQRFFQGTGASLGLQNELAPFAAGVATDVEGKKQDPIIAREIKAYEEANKVRQEAYNKLIELEQRSATALEGSLTEINSQLTQRLAPLVNDINAELEKLKQGLQAANNGNAPQPNAGANGAPPPPQAAPQVAAPATPPPAVAGTQAPPAAEEVAAAAAGIQQAQATSQTVEFGGSTQVVVSFNPDDLGQLQGMREGLQRDISQSIASALKEATGGKINLNLPGIA